jgi:hypothetical protein
MRATHDRYDPSFESLHSITGSGASRKHTPLRGCRFHLLLTVWLSAFCFWFGSNFAIAVNVVMLMMAAMITHHVYYHVSVYMELEAMCNCIIDEQIIMEHDLWVRTRSCRVYVRVCETPRKYY